MDFTTYLISSAILFWGYALVDSGKVAGNYFPSIGETNEAKTSPWQSNLFFERVYFSKSDAEKILGENAFLSDSSSLIKKDTLECKSAYTTYSKDEKSGKTGVIYFMIEQYSQESAAKNAYHAIKVANEKHEGVKVLQHMGDEAYFHSDGQNFYFILVRKGKIMFRMKVNKITSHTSLGAFNQVAGKISDDL